MQSSPQHDASSSVVAVASPQNPYHVIVHGVSRVNGAIAASVVPLRHASNWAMHPRRSQHVSLQHGQVTRLQVQNLSPGQKYRVLIQVGKTWHRVGVTAASADGGMVLPALRIDKAGRYLIALVRAGEANRYIDAQVR